MTGAIVSPHVTLAQVFFLVAIVAAALWLFGAWTRREEPYWAGALPVVLVFIGLGLLFST